MERNKTKNAKKYISLDGSCDLLGHYTASSGKYQPFGPIFAGQESKKKAGLRQRNI